MGGISNFTHVDHCVKAENAPLTDSHAAALLEVSTPVTSLRNFSALLGLGISAAIPAMARLARIVSVMSVSAIGMFVRYRFQYGALVGVGGTGMPCGMWAEYPMAPTEQAGIPLMRTLALGKFG